MTRRIPKDIRQQVYDKYNGHCAYCGCELEYKDMQVDHIDSVYLAEINKEEVNNDISNLMPSCRQCNFYKGTGNIETFRSDLENILTKTVAKPFQFRLAEKYGIVEYRPHKIKFYFEESDTDG